MINHESGITRITLHDYKVGYQVITSDEPTQYEHERCKQILFWSHVSPWDFSRDNSGWSDEERDIERIIEANLADPNVCAAIKNNHLRQYRSRLSKLFQNDHHQEHPITVDLIPNVFPRSRTYLTEYRIFWDGIRHHTARVTRDYTRAISRLTVPDTKSPMTNSAVTYRARLDNDTQPNDRGANGLIFGRVEDLDMKEILADIEAQKRNVMKATLADLDAQKRDLLEKLAVVQSKHDDINESRKRKYSNDDDGDTKPASKP